MTPSIGVERSFSRQVVAFAAAVVVAMSGIMAIESVVWSGQDLQKDREALTDAVKSYFLAEITGDTRKVWEMLAPSCEFKRAYSYEFYEEMQRRAGIRVKSYTLDELLEIKDNSGKSTMPGVDKVAAVRVHVVLVGRAGTDTRHTIVLTFLREAGRWFKG